MSHSDELRFEERVPKARSAKPYIGPYLKPYLKPYIDKPLHPCSQVVLILIQHGTTAVFRIATRLANIKEAEPRLRDINART